MKQFPSISYSDIWLKSHVVLQYLLPFQVLGKSPYFFLVLATFKETLMKPKWGGGVAVNITAHSQYPVPTIWGIQMNLFTSGNSWEGIGFFFHLIGQGEKEETVSQGG